MKDRCLSSLWGKSFSSKVFFFIYALAQGILQVSVMIFGSKIHVIQLVGDWSNWSVVDFGVDSWQWFQVWNKTYTVRQNAAKRRCDNSNTTCIKYIENRKSPRIRKWRYTWKPETPRSHTSYRTFAWGFIMWISKSLSPRTRTTLWCFFLIHRHYQQGGRWLKVRFTGK